MSQDKKDQSNDQQSIVSKLLDELRKIYYSGQIPSFAKLQAIAPSLSESDYNVLLQRFMIYTCEQELHSLFEQEATLCKEVSFLKPSITEDLLFLEQEFFNRFSRLLLKRKHEVATHAMEYMKTLIQENTKLKADYELLSQKHTELIKQKLDLQTTLKKLSDSYNEEHTAHEKLKNKINRLSKVEKSCRLMVDLVSKNIEEAKANQNKNDVDSQSKVDQKDISVSLSHETVSTLLDIANLTLIAGSSRFEIHNFHSVVDEILYQDPDNADIASAELLNLYEQEGEHSEENSAQIRAIINKELDRLKEKIEAIHTPEENNDISSHGEDQHAHQESSSNGAVDHSSSNKEEHNSKEEGALEAKENTKAPSHSSNIVTSFQNSVQGLVDQATSNQEKHYYYNSNQDLEQTNDDFADANADEQNQEEDRTNQSHDLNKSASAQSPNVYGLNTKDKEHIAQEHQDSEFLDKVNSLHQIIVQILDEKDSDFTPLTIDQILNTALDNGLFTQEQKNLLLCLILKLLYLSPNSIKAEDKNLTEQELLQQIKADDQKMFAQVCFSSLLQDVAFAPLESDDVNNAQDEDLSDNLEPTDSEDSIEHIDSSDFNEDFEQPEQEPKLDHDAQDLDSENKEESEEVLRLDPQDNESNADAPQSLYQEPHKCLNLQVLDHEDELASEDNEDPVVLDQISQDNQEQDLQEVQEVQDNQESQEPQQVTTSEPYDNLFNSEESVSNDESSFAQDSNEQVQDEANLTNDNDLFTQEMSVAQESEEVVAKEELTTTQTSADDIGVGQAQEQANDQAQINEMDPSVQTEQSQDQEDIGVSTLEETVSNVVEENNQYQNSTDNVDEVASEALSSEDEAKEEELDLAESSDEEDDLEFQRELAQAMATDVENNSDIDNAEQAIKVSELAEEEEQFAEPMEALNSGHNQAIAKDEATLVHEMKSSNPKDDSIEAFSKVTTEISQITQVFSSISQEANANLNKDSKDLSTGSSNNADNNEHLQSLETGREFLEVVQDVQRVSQELEASAKSKAQNKNSVFAKSYDYEQEAVQEDPQDDLANAISGNTQIIKELDSDQDQEVNLDDAICGTESELKEEPQSPLVDQDGIVTFNSPEEIAREVKLEEERRLQERLAHSKNKNIMAPENYIFDPLEGAVTGATGVFSEEDTNDNSSSDLIPVTTDEISDPSIVPSNQNEIVETKVIENDTSVITKTTTTLKNTPLEQADHKKEHEHQNVKVNFSSSGNTNIISTIPTNKAMPQHNQQHDSQSSKDGEFESDGDSPTVKQEMVESTNKEDNQAFVDQEPVSSETDVQDIVVQELVSKDSEVQEQVTQESVLEETVAQDSEVQEQSTQETVVQELVSQDSEVQEQATQETVVQEPVSQDSETQEQATQDAVVQETVSQDSEVQEQTTQESIVQDTVSQETEVQEQATQETVVQEPVSQDSETQEQATQDAVVQETVIEDSEVQEPVSQETKVQEQTTQPKPNHEKKIEPKVEPQVVLPVYKALSQSEKQEFDVLYNLLKPQISQFSCLRNNKSNIFVSNNNQMRAYGQRIYMAYIQSLIQKRLINRNLYHAFIERMEYDLGLDSKPKREHKAKHQERKLKDKKTEQVTNKGQIPSQYTNVYSQMGYSFKDVQFNLDLKDHLK